jgi:hypothetical protein
MHTGEQLRPHVFMAPDQPPLDWNGVHKVVKMVSTRDNPSPVDLEVGGPGSGAVRIALQPLETAKLCDFLDEHGGSVAMQVEAEALEVGLDPLDIRDMLEDLWEIVDGAVFWFGKAAVNNSDVTVIPAPKSPVSH